MNFLVSPKHKCLFSVFVVVLVGDNFIVKNKDTASTSIDVVVVYLLLALNRYYQLGYNTVYLVGIYLFKFNN